MNSVSRALLCALLAGCDSVSQTIPSAPTSAQTPSQPPLRFFVSAPGPRFEPRIVFERGAKVRLWATVPNIGYVFGQDASGKNTLSAINAQGNNCYLPLGIKVDNAENLWIACYWYDTGHGTAGAVQEYTPGSKTPAATYVELLTCGSCTFEAFTWDVVADTQGHVFAINQYSTLCNPSCNPYAYPVVWWNVKSPSSPPTGIADTNLQNAYYADVDTSGNLYVSGYGCIGSTCGDLVDEIGKPTTSPTITNLIAPSASTDFAGVAVSHGGKVLNVVDPGARTISQYALPWVTNELPFNVLGPTLLNYFGQGEPNDGSFDRSDKHLAIGDLDDWIDVGKVSKNRWSVLTNFNLNQPVYGAAYVPSDK